MLYEGFFLGMENCILPVEESTAGRDVFLELAGGVMGGIQEL